MGNCFATRANNHHTPGSSTKPPPAGNYNINHKKKQVQRGEMLPEPSNGQRGRVNGQQDQVASARSNEGGSSHENGTTTTTTVPGEPSTSSSGSSSNERDNEGGSKFNTPNLKMFTLSELVSATRNFRPDTMLGEGGFGRVFKGWIDQKTYAPSRVGVGMPVAVKKSNPDSEQGLREWQAEVQFLGKFSHTNLVKLFGYCWEEDQFLLVYEYMQKGSLDNHLFRKGAEPLSWEIRIKIATGAARGLAYLHSSEKSVIYRDFKTSNILLDLEYNAKLSDFGLAKLGPMDGNSHVTTRVIGTYGYAAPEYVETGHLYVKSDVYGFGVVLLELLTGLRALDPSRPSNEHNLVEWAKPSLSDKKKLRKIMDPRLEQQYPIKSAMQIAELVPRCLRPDPKDRPSMEEVRDLLVSLSTPKPKAPPPPSKVNKGKSLSNCNSPDKGSPAHRNYDGPKKSPLRPSKGVRIHPPSASSIWSRV